MAYFDCKKWSMCDRLWIGKSVQKVKSGKCRNVEAKIVKDVNDVKNVANDVKGGWLRFANSSKAVR